MAYFLTKNRLKGTTVLGFLLLCQIAFAQKDFSAIDKQLEADKKQLGGDFVALVVKDGKILYKKEIGDIKSNTQLPIASCSKWLTAAVLMQFVDEGKISLDDKVVNYLPIFGKYNKNYITIRHCLTHETGIERDKSLTRFLQSKKYENLEAEVNDIASKKEIDTNPGEEFQYSGVGLNIAARILEVVAKKPFDRIVSERLLRPLGMKNTSFSTDGNGAVNPSGGAKSTAEDYTKFLMLLLNKGVANGKQLLSEKAVAEITKEQVPISRIKYAPKAAEGATYGLGCWIIEKNEANQPNVISCPGLFGTWPYINTEKGYAAIFFTKSLLGEAKGNIYRGYQQQIDSLF